MLNKFEVLFSNAKPRTTAQNTVIKVTAQKCFSYHNVNDAESGPHFWIVCFRPNDSQVTLIPRPQPLFTA
jgi:hypothetical protein